MALRIFSLCHFIDFINFIYRRVLPNTKNIFSYIKDTYGIETYKLGRALQKEMIKYTKLEQHIEFLKICDSRGIKPNFVNNLNLPIKRLQNSKFRRDCQQNLLTKELKHKMTKLKGIRKDIFSRKKEMRNRLSWLVFKYMMDIIESDVSKENDKLKCTHAKKLLNLGYTDLCHPSPDKVVKNISSRILTEAELDVLAYGLEFCLIPRKVNTLKYFLPFEKLAYKLDQLTPPNQTNETGALVKNRLRNIAWGPYEMLKRRDLKENLSRDQLNTLHN